MFYNNIESHIFGEFKLYISTINCWDCFYETWQITIYKNIWSNEQIFRKFKMLMIYTNIQWYGVSSSITLKYNI